MQRGDFMNKNTQQQDLADKIARLKASKGKNIAQVQAQDTSVKNAKVQNMGAKKPAPVKNMKPMKNMSSGRKG